MTQTRGMDTNENLMRGYFEQVSREAEKGNSAGEECLVLGVTPHEHDQFMSWLCMHHFDMNEAQLEAVVHVALFTRSDLLEESVTLHISSSLSHSWRNTIFPSILEYWERQEKSVSFVVAPRYRFT